MRRPLSESLPAARPAPQSPSGSTRRARSTSATAPAAVRSPAAEGTEALTRAPRQAKSSAAKDALHGTASRRPLRAQRTRASVLLDSEVHRCNRDTSLKRRNPALGLTH